MDANSKRRTILVVYNDAGIREYESAILEDSGYKVVQEPDGAAALVLLQANDQIDLLFTGIYYRESRTLCPAQTPL